MSFSENLKKELMAEARKKTCCKKAFAVGLLFGASYSDTDEITLETELAELASEAVTAIKESFGRKAEVTEKSRIGHTRYVITFSSRSCALLLRGFDAPSDSASAEDMIGFRCDLCRINFLRGAFLSLAAVSDPVKSYHLEFCLKNAERAKLLYGELSKVGFTPKISNRRGLVGLYFKESGKIEDMLTYLGSSGMLFECLNDKILRDIRNDTNRKSNCETGNIAKTVGASQDVIGAIKKLEKEGRLAALPDDLRETARLRMDYPEASLSELCSYFDEPLSKSGLNHRLNKIKMIAEEK